ncbi:MAG: prolyl oligopeptidase family serine peptidase, partial [Roseibacillus sp.]
LRTPGSVFDYNMRTRKKTLLKEKPVLGGFDRKNYLTERLDATARDGKKVPISLVYRKGLVKDGSAPLFLYAYGSYGSSTHAGFRSSLLSLLDRGFVYALAHVRGGQEHGRSWYEDGKLMNKKNTFTDFIDCAEYLVKEKYASRDKLFASGGSAGGLLIGAVANMRPDLFRGLIADVPFVDVVTTMLDDTIPLTTFEYDEWGNPAEKAAYHYMLSYSPYDNVAKKEYPAMLVLAGLHDSQVQYWEPAKWVARLRHEKTGNNPVLLKTDMTAGHGGASGRFDRYKESALNYAFFLDLAGK